MAKKARQRIRYVLDSSKASAGGHKLGVCGLAVDRDNAILYSGGRDGIVCAWDLNLDLKHPASDARGDDNPRAKAKTTLRKQTQAHTHWVNDLCLAQSNKAVVSASSDQTVQVWRPHSEDGSQGPDTIGKHGDYAKCLAMPTPQSDWVASGGLDRTVCLWDLNGKGRALEIDNSGDEIKEKGSVYALSARPGVLACGGPEKVVRLWDPRTGGRVTKFVGHTDMIRALLINESGDLVISGSSDQTVKVWSVTAGRCMHTLTMHSDSVWALYSDEPDLGIFYSADKGGWVVKTDVRGSVKEMDSGLSLAIAKEADEVHNLVACGDYIWTATYSSSINRWSNIDTNNNEQLPEQFRQQRLSTASSRVREAIASYTTQSGPNNEIPVQAVLRVSNTAAFPALMPKDPETVTLGAPSTVRKGFEVAIEPIVNAIEPVHHLPEETIEGQYGIKQHRLLNDRRRVLTLDTAGEVALWDIIKCTQLKSFGKGHLEDVEPEVNTLEAIAPWCSIDCSSGNLQVVLDPFNCFDAEVYGDELALEEPVEFKEDQRINLGKWILRYLFAGLIDEEIKRDEAYRQNLNEAVGRRAAVTRANAPSSITIPESAMAGLEQPGVTTPRANGSQLPSRAAGLGIGLATPGASSTSGPTGEAMTPLSPLDKRISHTSGPLGEKGDYFASGNAISSADGSSKAPQTPATDTSIDEKPAKPTVDTKVERVKESGKSPSTPFGKKFKMSFGTKKLGRSASQAASEKPAVVDEQAEESESSSNHEKEFDDSFLGAIQKIRNEYDKQLTENPDKLIETRLTPTLPSDTPVLKLPPGTKLIIQEENSGGSDDLYRGTVATVGQNADTIEQQGPMWLGDALLTNTTAPKDAIKISFILNPMDESLPSIPATDGNNRLNANRMLRVRKILHYVAERIDPPPGPENPDPDALKPEEYLELYCNKQLLPVNMTLATLRAQIWKGGNDVMLYYKTNGRKTIRIPPTENPVSPLEVEPSLQSETAGQGSAIGT